KILQDSPVVVFDLETTSFGIDSSICQIAASYDVPTLSQKDALESFIEWIPLNSVLVAHNCNNFDARILVSSLQRYGLLDKLKHKHCCFSDTLSVFREILPPRSSYSEENLVNDYLHTEYSAHNAKHDVHMLQQLIGKCNVDISHISKHSFSVDFIIEALEFLLCKKKNLSSLSQLISKKVITKCMAEKIAASGLAFCHLNLAYSRGGIDGLVKLLSEDYFGHPRFTNPSIHDIFENTKLIF
ncbi:uncharacterized protein LOC102802316, partial [Saccoglossus kowalevskii]|uniref:Uncharacterized protein LOC102802316 n=1 Tax=Saccoglossus kowalevskii TaxID=10224 RepID=A0ABM0MNU9_SACKO